MSDNLIPGLLLGAMAAILIIKVKAKKRTIVLGRQMAEGLENEKHRINSGNFSPSPLADFTYRKWPDEDSLVNPIENELDVKIIQLCSDFRQCDEEKRAIYRNSLATEDIYTLMEFSKRATLFAIRHNEPSYLQNGFTAISIIESERCDYRDVFVALSFLNYGLQTLNRDGSAIFTEAIRLSEGKTVQSIERFISKPSSIEAMGYVAVETTHGVSFISANYEKYNPEKNLVKILFQISDHIFQDKYRKGTITVGDKIYSGWLSADNNKRVETAISKATGCASLNAKIREEFGPKNDGQMLLIYLAEFKDDKSLQILKDQVNATVPARFCRISFIVGDLFFVAIQRATVAGVSDFETNESLKRFESPIRKIIELS